MLLPLHTIEGESTLDASEIEVRAFLHFLLNTEQWKDRMEHLHDRALRFRKDLIQGGRIYLPGESPAPPKKQKPAA